MKEHQHRGLTSAQVEESRRLHGDNLITPRKGDSAWKLFAEKFRDPIIQVLLVAALLSLAMAFIDGEFLETIGIIWPSFWPLVSAFSSNWTPCGGSSGSIW